MNFKKQQPKIGTVTDIRKNKLQERIKQAVDPVSYGPQHNNAPNNKAKDKKKIRLGLDVK